MKPFTTLSRLLVARRNGAFHGKAPTLVRSGPPGPLSRPVSVQCHTRFEPQPDGPSPQSQSLSRSYGSNLPTSLTYIVLSTRGCSPWRPAADMGTVWHENHNLFLIIYFAIV
ncbi:hypothetical protein X975_21862, partial [Stegodyphus mimosarum]